MRPFRHRHKQPPWPPGLETLKKALRGPRRLRSALDLSAPYDDTVLIALAISRFLRHGGAYQLSIPGFMLRCELMAPELPDSIANVLRIAIEETPPRTLPDSQLRTALENARIRVSAELDDRVIHHEITLVRRGEGELGVSWEPSTISALKVLRSDKGVIA